MEATEEEEEHHQHIHHVTEDSIMLQHAQLVLLDNMELVMTHTETLIATLVLVVRFIFFYNILLNLYLTLFFFVSFIHFISFIFRSIPQSNQTNSII